MERRSTKARQDLSYSIEGLSIRENLLLRSFMYVLSKNTIHNWIYRSVDHSWQFVYDVDLRMISEEKLPRQILKASHGHSHLILGYLKRQRPGFMRLPVDPKSLLKELNRLGNLITAARAQAKTTGYGASAASTNETVEYFCLVRWPPAKLLRRSQHIQLSAVMSRQAVTLKLLERLSGLPAVLCKEFLFELKKADLIYASTLLHAQTWTSSNAALSNIPGLIADIRRQLSLKISCNR